MADSSGKPWTNNPDAPQIPHWLYLTEKENFAGIFLGAIFYGVVIVLFFQCMSALFNPVNRAMEGIRWGLVAYTVAMFSIITTFIAMNLDIQSVSYVDNRAFPGSNVAPPGPFGYQFTLYSKPIGFIANFLFPVNNWLADGLLLYRCYVIYSKNFWVIAFPCVMYLASVAMGIATNYEVARPDSTARYSNAIRNFGISWFSITLLLNVLLTFMIVARLFLHNRKIRKMGGALSSRTYVTVATMLIESCALYGATLILFIAPWGARNYVEYTFLLLLADVQVIAPFLIIIRVANRRAFSDSTVISGTAGSVVARKPWESMSSGTTFPDGRTVDSMHGGDGKAPGEPAAGAVAMVDFHCDEV